MINFFRKIRQQLAYENKFQKYFRYAFGEVALIMIGIFMALQLNNWNEKRQQEIVFKATLEQLYTTIKYDAEAFNDHSGFFNFEVTIIDSLLNSPDSFSKTDLPSYLYTINLVRPYTSESVYHSKELNYNPENQGQKEITKEILKYINRLNAYKYQFEDRLTQSLQNINIPLPKQYYNTGKANWDVIDSTYYSKEDIKNITELIHSNRFKAILKTTRTYLIFNYHDAKNMYTDGLSIRKLIKTYYPEVKVTYKDVGIIGTAIDGYDDVGAKSTPMKLTDPEKNIWEVNLYLKKGSVKFRCRDSWTQNWGYDYGENYFPKGKTMQDGVNIDIPEAGNYKVILNLSENYYEFIKQKN